ncbi:MAG: GT4 family glycosyltransferase PelF [Verrucomicrobiaceae bacterium]
MAAKHTTLADVCLVLEGTYPYVSGGVSTWVHQIMGMFPDLNFAIFYLGAQKDASCQMKYELPPNLVALEEVYLFDLKVNDGGILAGMGVRWQPFFESVRKLGVRLPEGDAHDLELLRSILAHITNNSRISFDTFWRNESTWGVVRELYDRYAPDESFIDFFWTLRFLVQPLWKLARAMHRMPEAKIYHTACTGYAGLAAALASAERGKPLMLTEHGIYLRERIADICRSPWIPDQLVRHPNLNEPLGSLRRLWIGFFDVVGRLCYTQSSDIVSLFGKNALAQQHFGADAGRMTIIPNGIRTEAFEPVMLRRVERRIAQPGSQVVGFLGRVVSIKDVKTLLRAAAKVCAVLPAAKFIIGGPPDEEPEYVRECLDLKAQLGLQDRVSFIGPVKRDAFLVEIDVMILSSISEGLPFVIIESLAAGVPVVSTDVGACSELLRGRPDESPALGEAGLIAEIGNSDELAAHLVRVLTDANLLESLSQAGLQRVKQLYQEHTVQESYRDLYQKHLDRLSVVVGH